MDVWYHTSMVVTLSFPSEKVRSTFLQLLLDEDSEISFTICEELEASIGSQFKIVRVSKEEFEVIEDND